MPNAQRHTAKPDYWDEAVAHLMRRDRILKKIIPRHPDVWLTARGTPFVALARAITGQQISTKAADAIWQRVADCCGRARRFSAAAVIACGHEQLRTAGLSQRKTEYLLDLARHFHERLVHPSHWGAMDDEALIKELTAIRGIGRWTVEMFLIFHLQRPDVLPLDDLGLIKAISQHYFSSEPVSRFEAREVAQAWQPWRTVATWYLWRSIAPSPAPASQPAPAV